MSFVFSTSCAIPRGTPNIFQSHESVGHDRATMTPLPIPYSTHPCLDDESTSKASDARLDQAVRLPRSSVFILSFSPRIHGRSLFARLQPIVQVPELLSCLAFESRLLWTATVRLCPWCLFVEHDLNSGDRITLLQHSTFPIPSEIQERLPRVPEDSSLSQFTSTWQHHNQKKTHSSSEFSSINSKRVPTIINSISNYEAFSFFSSFDCCLLPSHYPCTRRCGASGP